MSDSAPKHFADIASALGVLLDNHKPEKTNHTFLTLHDLSQQLPEDSSLRKVISEQMVHILSFDFPVNPDTTNKTLVIMGQIKDGLSQGDSKHSVLDKQMARVLTSKFEKVNGHAGSKSESSSADREDRSKPKMDEAPRVEAKRNPFDSKPEDRPEPKNEEKPVEKPEPKQEVVKPKPEPKPEPTPEPEPVKAEPAPEPELVAEAKPVEQPNDELAGMAHKVQLSLDQLSEATRKAFPELAPIYEHGGTAQAYLEYLKKQPGKDGQDNPAKSEMEKLLVLAEKIENVPAEAEQFQVLYDQVDAKHKDPKTGVFSIFQRDYNGDAKLFAVKRTDQYAKYVDAEESRQRMVEDLHKLIEQANKNLSENKNSANAGGGSKSGNSDRSFLHG